MKALALAQQNLLPGANSWFLTSVGVMYRFGAAGLILCVIFSSKLKTISRRETEQGMVIAIFGAGGILFQMDGIGYTAASTCAFLTQGYCIFIPLWVALTRRRRPPSSRRLPRDWRMSGWFTRTPTNWSRCTDPGRRRSWTAGDTSADGAAGGRIARRLFRVRIVHVDVERHSVVALHTGP